MLQLIGFAFNYDKKLGAVIKSNQKFRSATTAATLGCILEKLCNFCIIRNLLF